jgi:hypothetical protein
MLLVNGVPTQLQEHLRGGTTKQSLTKSNAMNKTILVVIFSVAVLALNSQTDSTLAAAKYQEALAAAESSKRSYMWAFVAFGSVLLLRLGYFVYTKYKKQK